MSALLYVPAFASLCNRPPPILQQMIGYNIAMKHNVSGANILLHCAEKVFGDILMQVVEWHDVSTLAKASHYF
jgi:hypothetical protein